MRTLLPPTHVASSLPRSPVFGPAVPCAAPSAVTPCPPVISLHRFRPFLHSAGQSPNPLYPNRAIPQKSGMEIITPDLSLDPSPPRRTPTVIPLQQQSRHPHPLHPSTSYKKGLHGNGLGEDYREKRGKYRRKEGEDTDLERRPSVKQWDRGFRQQIV